MSDYARRCDVCADSAGFFARPCPGCLRQKPLDERHAAIYELPVGHLIKPGDLALWTGRKWRAIKSVLAEVRAQQPRWSGRQEVIG